MLFHLKIKWNLGLVLMISGRKWTAPKPTAGHQLQLGSSFILFSGCLLIFVLTFTPCSELAIQPRPHHGPYLPFVQINSDINDAVTQLKSVDLISFMFVTCRLDASVWTFQIFSDDKARGEMQMRDRWIMNWGIMMLATRVGKKNGTKARKSLSRQNCRQKPATSNSRSAPKAVDTKQHFNDSDILFASLNWLIFFLIIKMRSHKLR